MQHTEYKTDMSMKQKQIFVMQIAKKVKLLRMKMKKYFPRIRKIT